MKRPSSFVYSAVCLLLILSVFLACRPSPQAAAAPPPDGTPRLVVLVVADQFRADYLERGQGIFTAGLRRLRDDGVVFTEAHQAHSVTETAPGHATLSTGAYPAHHGIVGNDWFDRTVGDEVYCVEDEDEELEISPHRLRVAALGDWLRARYPTARVVSASAKDRAAVLLGGRHPDAALWYDRWDGGFTTSPFYAEELPTWLVDFNHAGPPVDFFHHPWEPLPMSQAQATAATRAGFMPFDRGPFDHGFPRLVGGFVDRPDSGGFWNALYRTPALDAWLGSLAQEMVRRFALGADEVPDLLALSFSATDAVGHGYGPDSLEVLDTLRRLDVTLGELFDFLDREVGPGHWVAAFSSDHGVAPLPEQVGPPAARAGLAEVTCFRDAASRLSATYGDDVWLADEVLDPDVIRRAGADPVEVARRVAADFAACPHVHRVRVLADVLAEAAPAPRPAPGGSGWTDALYRHGADPERSPDLLVQLDEYFDPNTTDLVTHGSPWPYDTHVPLVVLLPGTPPGQIPTPTYTTDLAPTLAHFLDVPVPDTIDGQDRSQELTLP
jgi:arylsulfatase A-like enzyme